MQLILLSQGFSFNRAEQAVHVMTFGEAADKADESETPEFLNADETALK